MAEALARVEALAALARAAGVRLCVRLPVRLRLSVLLRVHVWLGEGECVLEGQPEWEGEGIGVVELLGEKDVVCCGSARVKDRSKMMTGRVVMAAPQRGLDCEKAAPGYAVARENGEKHYTVYVL